MEEEKKYLFAVIQLYYVQDSIEVSYLNYLRAYADYRVPNPEKYTHTECQLFGLDHFAFCPSA